MTRALLILGLLVLVAVHAAGCAVFADKADYADYRAVRLSQPQPARLVAMRRYVERHPDGHWRAEVQAERHALDLETFEAGKATRAGLEHYLDVFPRGTFAAQARVRLSTIDTIAAQKRTEAARAQALAQERKARAAELRRTWVTRFFGYWAKTLLGLSAWGTAIPELARQNPEFSRAFGAAPRPRCTQDECVKYYTSEYAIPIPSGTRIERSISMLLRLRMTDGKLDRAELLMPGRGFSRWYEIEERRPVVDADTGARREAVEWALARLSQFAEALATVRPDPAPPAFAEILPPTIAPTGELIDTSAEDPGVPSTRRASGSGAPEGVDVPRRPGSPDESAPETQAAPDMVFAPLQVDEAGRARNAAEVAREPAVRSPGAGASGEPPKPPPPLIMEPLAVPRAPEAEDDDDTPALFPELAPRPAEPPVDPPVDPTPPVPIEAPAAPPAIERTVRAFISGELRIVFFAAGSDAPGAAYDGMLIQRVTPQAKPGKGARHPAKRPRRPGD